MRTTPAQRLLWFLKYKDEKADLKEIKGWLQPQFLNHLFKNS
jgi:hypothetical protein